MSRRRKAGGGSADVVTRLQQRIEEGDFYEALQLYKSSYARFKSKGSADEAHTIVTAGAVAMAKQKELNAAVELGELLLESFEELELEADEVRLKQVEEIAEAWPDKGIELVQFLKRALAWMGRCSSPISKKLRVLLARAYIAGGDYGSAAKNFCVAGAVDEYAEVLGKWTSMGYLSERDLFLCRAVLHSLSLGRMEDASDLWEKGLAAIQAQDSKGAATAGFVDSPLCHFTLNLLELCAMTSAKEEPSPKEQAAFRWLENTYLPSLDRDGTTLPDMVQRIGEVHFGLQTAGPGGMFGSILQMLG